MADNFKITDSSDSVYTINGYGAVQGLQRFNYSYTANEEDIQEIGNSINTAITIDPETSISFEVTDTANLAALLARMRYNHTSQDYGAGVSTDITTNAFSFDQDDIEFLISTFGEYKAPGEVFDTAVLFPYHFVTSIGIRVNADGIGSVTFDAEGSLFKPIYKPYHTTRAYPVQYATDTTADIAAGWSVASGTHNLLALEVNNEIIEDGDLAWSDADTITISNNTIDDDDRLMLWAFEKTPGSLPAIDYVNSIRFVRPDRINIWLMPETGTPSDANNYLRVQSLDLTVDVTRDELKEIAKNERKSSTFYRAPQYPLDITGQLSILETTLEKWAELQGKTLNESATVDTIDQSNVLDITSWEDAKVVVEWYKYGNDSPIQKMVCSGVQFSSYDSTQEVGGRKEATWNVTTSEFYLEGFDV